MSYDADTKIRPWCPPVDVYRADHHYVVKADIPGMRLPEISVIVRSNTLSISGERHFQAGEHVDEHLRLERLHGRFICEVHLPGMQAGEAVDIIYTDGVLSVQVPIK